jgi:tetratricopeptide (TPR) repeat protein
MKKLGSILIFAALFITVNMGKADAQTVMSGMGMKFIPKSEKDTSRVNTLARTGYKYLLTDKKYINQAKACIDTALLICEKKDIEVPALLHLLIASYNYLQNDFTYASREGNAALEMAKRSGDKNLIIRSMAFMGSYYHKTGYYKESLDHYSEAIDLAIKNKIKGLLPKIYEGKANVFNSIGDIEGYQRTLGEMIAAAKTENSNILLTRGLYLLGSNLIENKRNFHQADSNLKACIERAIIVKDTFFISNGLANLGYNFYIEGMLDSSLMCYEKSLKYSITAGDLYSSTANALGNIGNIYRDWGKSEKAISYYKKSISFSGKVNDWYNLYWVYLDMSKMYLKLRDTSNAFQSYVLYKQYSDSTLFKNRNQWFSNARLRYDTDTRNKEVELLSLRVKNQRILNFTFAILTLLAILISWLLYRGSKLQAKRRISEMNRQISEIQQANLRQQMNPHFIFNTLNSIQYYMYQHDKLATNNYMTKFSSLMRKVLENSQHTSIPLSDELNALTLYLELECIRFKDKFDYEINVDEEIDTLMYKVPTMLIQPYVENSICHGVMPLEGKGSVRINIRQENAHLICTIEDNGIGREAAKERSDRKAGNHNSLGTQIAASRLDLVNSLYGTTLKTVYTDLKDSNGNPAGTRVEIHIPIIA